jgi:DNA-damage-inducible protein J
MMSSVALNIRIDKNCKEQAQDVFSQLGLSMSGAIDIYFRQVILRKGIPFAVELPNKETTKAIEQLESGKGRRFSTVEDLFEDLNN